MSIILPRILAYSFLGGVFLSGTALLAQPFYDTSVPNAHVDANTYKGQARSEELPPSYESVRSRLPEPIWPDRPDVLKCYEWTWRRAFGNLHAAPANTGLISPFIDPAFNAHIFMWDSTFMMMFGRYGRRGFDFQQTLDNFYAKQHKDGFICREIRESDGTDVFEKFDPSSTGPYVLPWAEWEYFLNTGNEERLGRIFPALLAFHEWMHINRTWPDGTYYSTGWGCGMDDQPRLPAGEHPNWSTGGMSWVDTSLQQVFSGRILLRAAAVLGREAEVENIKNEVRNLTDLINQRMWNPEARFYVDRFKNGELSTVKSVAGYWALLAQVASTERANAIIAQLEDPKKFKRLHRVNTLSADHPEFEPKGGYWKGAVWAPTNYMVLRGLTQYGRDALAYEIALNHLNNVVKVFTETGTLRENYAPDFVQGNDGKDFVGWTGIVPITVLFEYIFGLRPDVPSNSLVWDIRLTDEHGVKKYPFGDTALIDLHVAKRAAPNEPPAITVTSSRSMHLRVRWAGGEQTLSLTPDQTYSGQQKTTHE